MAIDLTISLAHRPGTLAEASDALGRAGVNIEGACGLVSEGSGVFHVLVEDAERARRALIDAGFDIRAERQVALVRVENRPREAARLLRRVADTGANLDLIYATVDGRLVLCGDDIEAIRSALA